MGLRSWFLESEKETRPVKEVMGEKYRELADWLHQSDLGGDELKETFLGCYQDIQDQIQRLDNAFVIENMETFQDAIERIKQLYAEALFRTGRKIAVRAWSEPLQAYLWVVADDEDIKALRSQGISEAIYTAEEVKKLRGLSKDSLKTIHKVKEAFESSKVEEILPKENGKG